MTKLLKSGLGSVVCLFVLVAVITLAQGPQVVLGASGAAWVGGFADPGGGGQGPGQGGGGVFCNAIGLTQMFCPEYNGQPCGGFYDAPINPGPVQLPNTVYVILGDRKCTWIGQCLQWQHWHFKKDPDHGDNCIPN